MRIAHFIHRYPPAHGGAETYFARLSETLVEAGHSVTVFTTTALDLTAFWNRYSRQLPAGITWQNGVEVRRFPLIHYPGHRYFFKFLSLFPQRDWQAWTMWCSPRSPGLWKATNLCQESFDLVHATALPYTWPILAARNLARRLGIPSLLTPFVHLGDLARLKNSVRRAYTRPSLLRLVESADQLFVQTEVERQALQELGIPDHRLILQGMGIRPGDAIGGNRDRFRQKWGLDPGMAVIGHLANLSQEKGTIDLLRAYWADDRLRKQSRLILAGEQMPNFKRYWNALANKEGVLLLGPLTESEKKDFYAGIDLFVLPSRVDSFGIVVLEAWANKLPVIVYRAGGLPGVVRDGVDGIVVSCGDLPALSDAIDRLLINPTLRQHQGKTGQVRVQEHWTLERSLQIVLATYQNVISIR